MNCKGPRTIDNEADWLEYGWQFYYALLNCGLKVRPGAGSASGAHPVPVGYSRVYVHLPGGFNFDAWLAGLKAGRSFVSTGPMLLVTVNDRDPGETFDASTAKSRCTFKAKPSAASRSSELKSFGTARSFAASNHRTRPPITHMLAASI